MQFVIAELQDASLRFPVTNWFSTSMKCRCEIIRKHLDRPFLVWHVMQSHFPLRWMIWTLLLQGGMCRLQINLVGATCRCQLLKRETRESQKANSKACFSLLHNFPTKSRQCHRIVCYAPQSDLHILLDRIFLPYIGKQLQRNAQHLLNFIES